MEQFQALLPEGKSVGCLEDLAVLRGERLQNDSGCLLREETFWC